MKKKPTKKSIGSVDLAADPLNPALCPHGRSPLDHACNHLHRFSDIIKAQQKRIRRLERLLKQAYSPRIANSKIYMNWRKSVHRALLAGKEGK